VPIGPARRPPTVPRSRRADPSRAALVPPSAQADGGCRPSPVPLVARAPAVPPAHRISERGQASVEFVAILPLVALVVFAGWQFLLVGDALWHARTAARAAARAQAIGADPRDAARAHLPPRLEGALQVEDDDGDVRVSLRVPAVIPALAPGRVSATAHFDRQDG
jgi:TadE-like protein